MQTFNIPRLVQVSALVILFATATHSLGDDVDRADFVMQGMRAERERLEMGLFRAQGILLDDDPVDGRLEGEVELFVAFEWPKQRIRFDRIEPKRTCAVDGNTWQVGKTGGQYARTTDAMIMLRIGDEIASSLPVHHPTPPWSRAFDVRALGLGYKRDLDQGTPFAEIWTNYQTSAPIEVALVEEGVYRMTWILPSDTKRTLWVDTRRGYWPIRLELRMKNKEQWGEPFLVSELQLADHAGLWLPEQFTLRQYHQSHTLNFAWESVNEALPDSLFSLDGLDLNAAEYVMDSRLGETIILRGPVDQAATEDPVKSTQLWAISVGVGIGCLLLLVTWRCRSHRRAHSG